MTLPNFKNVYGASMHSVSIPDEEIKPKFRLVYGVSIPEEKQLKGEIILEKFKPTIIPEEKIILSINERLTNLEALINRMSKEFLTVSKKMEDLYSKLNLKQNLPTRMY